jgi:hypothetical protein
LIVILSKRSLRGEGSGRAARIHGACPERAKATEGRVWLASLSNCITTGSSSTVEERRFSAALQRPRVNRGFSRRAVKKERSSHMPRNTLLVLSGALLALAGYLYGSRNATIAYANPAPQAGAANSYDSPRHGTVPKSFGHIAAAIPDQIGTGLIFEDSQGVIRFVSMTGMKEGELARYDQTPTRGGIPKSYGHLVAAVVNPDGTGLVFEDSEGVIRFVTITGKKEAELTRN